MKVFREYGEKRSVLRFSGEALKILAYAPDPQAALEEANSRKEAGEAVTAKIAREIAAAQKAQQEAGERALHLHVELQPEHGAASRAKERAENPAR